MRPYAERRAARIERLRTGAERAGAASDAAFEAARRIGSQIPFGQPILVGHHSERRARRDAERIDRNMAKSVALGREAGALARRAEAAESSEAISSDDPEAVAKLKAKLAELDATQARMKVLNAAFRRGPERFAAVATEAEQAAARRLFQLSSYEKLPYPGYALSNNSGNIRRIKERIAKLEAKAALSPAEPVTIGAIVIDEQDNRTRIHFPGKPSAETIAALKSNGFRWCRSDSCWQRMASPYARTLAQQIAGRC